MNDNLFLLNDREDITPAGIYTTLDKAIEEGRSTLRGRFFVTKWTTNAEALFRKECELVYPEPVHPTAEQKLALETSRQKYLKEFEDMFARVAAKNDISKDEARALMASKHQASLEQAEAQIATFQPKV